MSKPRRQLEGMFRKLLYPALVVSFLSLTWFLMHRVDSTIWDLVPGLLSLPTLGLMLCLERKLPRRPQWLEDFGETWSDWLHTLVLFPIVLKVAQLTASVLALRPFGFAGLANPLASWGVIPQFAVWLVVAEFCFYWFHRFSHELPFLWNFHRVHHGAQRVYFANAGRFHPVDLWLVMTVYFFPLYLFQLPQEIMVLFLAANVITGLLEHANVDFSAGPFNYVFNTAELHRWHHSTILKEANQNYGKVLCVWDLAFRSHCVRHDSEIDEVGLTAGEAIVPPTIRGQWGVPFRKKRREDLA